jgi:HK97 family phage major capsid protein
MNERIKQLRATIEENLAKLRAMLDLADGEKRDLTAEETGVYDTLDKATDKLQHDLEREEKLAIQTAAAEERKEKPYQPDFGKRKAASPKEFSCFGEFVYNVCYNRNDPRLQDLYQSRDQTMGDGTKGGFMVPEQWRGELMQVQPQEQIIRPRATVIPAGDPPDAKLSMPALDQTNAENIYGGVVVAAVAEAGTKGETDIRFKEISLEPTEVAGWIRASDKLLRNWGAASSVISTQLRKAIAGWEDYRFLRGSGVAEPLGIINSPAKINVTRQTASQVTWQDIRTMYSRMKFGGSPTWIASQTILPYLMQIADGGSNNLFVTAYASAAGSIPATLLGFPIVFADRAPALGSEGDLILADCSYYLIKNGSGPFVEASPHVYFTSNQTVIKAFWNVDGKPWLTQPIGLEGSTSNTVSPFVVLQ